MNLHIIQYNLTIRYQRIVFTILPLMYIVGFIGLQIPATKPYFQELSAFNLWVSVILLLFFHQGFNRSFISFCIICFGVGYGIEVVGVHTGLIFGSYWYGQTLGTKVAEVPIVIGANWLLLVYCSGIVMHQITNRYKIHPLAQKAVQALGIGVIMTSLDYLIEPIAIQLDFWQWQYNTIPQANFNAWFVVATCLGYYFATSSFKKENKLAFLLLFLQIIFFVAHTTAFYFK
ncbi:carotenoid biosynthesis protein [Flectobacillus major]|uniref:carotenoid biosynthesis protein n=1 Tax=Flectobacillus major TaxID=103 RepID=UPI0005C7242A|nr:carotenoid biosynthesis protein [Flectobacillus major]